MSRKNKSRNLGRWVKRHQNKHFCQCDCGEYIEIKRDHHKISVGIPRFIKGHNLQLDKSGEDVSSDTIVQESVWDKLSPEEQERRLSHLKSFGTREDNPSWKGGRRVDENGYVQILMPEHPKAKDGYMAEHRFVVEERTRRENPDSPLLILIKGEKYLRTKAIVHHIDEVKDNNDSSNLMLLPNQAAHSFIHRSPLPMEERLRRISLGIFHSGPLTEE